MFANAQFGIAIFGWPPGRRRRAGSHAGLSAEKFSRTEDGCAPAPFPTPRPRRRDRRAREKHNRRFPDVLLRAVPITDDRIKSLAVRIGHQDMDNQIADLALFSSLLTRPCTIRLSR